MLEIIVSASFFLLQNGNMVEHLEHDHEFALQGFLTPDAYGLCEQEKRLGEHFRERIKQILAAQKRDIVEVPCTVTHPTKRKRCAVVTINGESLAAVLEREGLAVSYKPGHSWCEQPRPTLNNLSVTLAPEEPAAVLPRLAPLPPKRPVGL